MKAQGLLALLCLSDGYCRTRAWLQAMLWSDRSRGQASTSLRQSLSEIRTRLGPDLRDALVTDRRTVALDGDMLSINPAAADGSQEFLEGIDIQDPAFLAWLNEARNPALTGTPPPPIAPMRGMIVRPQEVALVVGNTDHGFGSLFSEIIVGEIGTLLREAYGLQPMSKEAVHTSSRPVLVTCQSAAHQGQVLVNIRAQDGLSGPDFWSGSRQIEAKGAPPVKDVRISQIVLETCEAISEHVAAGRVGSGSSYAFALRQAKADIFSLDQVRIKEADKTLLMLSEDNVDDTVLAWRLFLRVILLMENLTDDPGAIREEVFQFVREAEMRPPNSLLLSSISYAQSMVMARIAEAAESARRAIDHNAANPFAWFAASLVRVHLGDFEESFRFIVRARYIESLTSRRHWWDGVAAVAATAAGNTEVARKFAEDAHGLAPDFKVPLRYLIALYARDNRLADAEAMRDKLKSVEQDFSVERLWLDDQYPAATLRRTGVLSDSPIKDLK